MAIGLLLLLVTCSYGTYLAHGADDAATLNLPSAAANNTKHPSFLRRSAHNIIAQPRQDSPPRPLALDLANEAEAQQQLQSSRHLDGEDKKDKEFEDYLLGDYFVKLAYNHPLLFILLLMVGLIATCIWSMLLYIFLPIWLLILLEERIRADELSDLQRENNSPIQKHTATNEASCCGSACTGVAIRDDAPQQQDDAVVNHHHHGPVRHALPARAHV
jgi:hypothetical protein